jgi:cysteinyl-tRNA synthetase
VHAISLFDTAQRTLTPIEAHDNRLTLYVCGVTPYDTTHLGHAFTYTVYDVLVRFLRARDITVRYAQNVTDIDDDILREARKRGVAFDTLARTETEQYVNDMAALNNLTPDFFVPATTVIPRIVTAIEDLIESGVAYQVGDNVYFDTSKPPEYGALAHASREKLLELAAEHGGNPDDPNKRDPLDFLLWQGRRDDDPSWSSPFGPGRPGWHIECSTIAAEYLGSPIDIHGGGCDLIFPHHASEIVQAETLGASPFVRCWMHTAMVRMDGEKMSKSLGNMVFIRDLIRTYSPTAIRLYLLSHHFRTPFEWDEKELQAMQPVADWYDRQLPSDDPGPGSSQLVDHLRNDLNTPLVVEWMRDASTRLLNPQDYQDLAWAGGVFGLRPAALSSATAGSIQA